MSRRERLAEEDGYREWKGGYRSYDIIKEACIALGVVVALVLVLTIVFSSPDEKPSTVKSWATSMPLDFVTTATTELDGSSGTGSYGPPYNDANGSVQHAWFLHPQRWLGVSHPINTAQDFVLAPLRSITGQPALQAAVTTYENASSSQQSTWTTAYEKGLADKSAKATASGTISVPNGNYGPLPTMMTGLLQFAQSGGLDGALLTSKQFYQTDYTKPLMFMADGGLLASRAQSDHLLGSQWGMMNETGSYPGLALILIPFIPGVRDVPRWIPIYKLIWREHYKATA